MSFLVSKDQSIIGLDGKVIYFSLQRFIQNIIEDDNCFICGSARGSKPFNDEHIIPKWLLRKYELYGSGIVMPNGYFSKYESHTVPCCTECNSYLGKTYEEPLRKAFDGGFKGISRLVKEDGLWKLFIWLNLLFFKQHYKDRLFRLQLDKRLEDDRTVADIYDVSRLHHIHCIIRSGYTGAVLDKSVLGSIFILPAYTGDGNNKLFDYGDLTFARSVLLRLNDVAIIGLLCDSCAIGSSIDMMKLVEGPLSEIQIREVFAYHSYACAKLKTTPRFYSEMENNLYHIRAEIKEPIVLEDFNLEEWGALFSWSLQTLLNDQVPEQVIKNIKSGKYTFLRNQQGEFDRSHMGPLES
jgi:hypothetical protein